MTTRELFDDHQEINAGTFGVFARISAYSLGILLAMWGGDTFFQGDYTATTGIFMLYSGILELLSAGTLRSHRFVAYCVCVLLMGAVGFLLLRQSALRPCAAPPPVKSSGVGCRVCADSSEDLSSKP